MCVRFGLSSDHLNVFTCSLLTLFGILVLTHVVVGLPIDAEGVSSHEGISSLDQYTPCDEKRISSLLSSPWYFCFEDKCKCRNNEADCSQNYGKLPFIPRLPAGITSLNFSSNSLKAIPRDFFVNVTTVSFLDLSNNELYVIHREAFSVFTNITGLVLKQNTRLSYLKLYPVFSVPSLEYLDVSHMRLGRIPAHLFHVHAFTRLRKLDMSGNRIMSGNLTMFALLKSLRSLGLASNDITHVTMEAVLKLQTINLEHNYISVFPDSCKGNSSLFPNLNALILRLNDISVIPAEICLLELRFLDLSQNRFFAFLSDTFTRSRFPSLLNLDLSSMRMSFSTEDYTFNNNGLETLSLAGNRLHVDVENGLNPHTFRGCGNLSTLILSGNRIGQVSEDTFQQLFGVLPRLHTLDLSLGNMKNIPQFTIATFPALQQLFLRKNIIESLPSGVLNETKSLKVLDLSKNSLSVVPENTFSEATRNNLQHLDLSGNPFTCSCELRWFRQWFVSQPSLFNHSHNSYTCTYETSSGVGSGKTKLASFYLDQQACLLSDSVYLVIVAIGSVIMIILTMILIEVNFILCFCKKPLLIRGFGGHENRIRFAANNDYAYDIFVAYAEGDSEWVREYLVPELEEGLRLRLCLHQRDFHPGRNILDNIEDSLERSKRALMIFSTHFANSQWCQFELGLCQRHIMDNGDVMLVVCLEEVQPREWTSGMMAILRTSTYLRWPQLPRDRGRFWGILHAALQDLFRLDHPQA